MKCKTATYLFLHIILFVMCNYAQEETNSENPYSVEYLSSLSLEDLMNITITSSSKIEQRTIESPSIVSVITSQQIEEYGWISTNDILYKQPGFGPAQDYDRHTTGSRGLFEGWNNNHLLMLIDGVPMNDNLYGTAYTWEVTPLLFVKNVEILRGPGSALYGSNATNGVIQINTLQPSDLKDGGKAEVKLGNNGNRIYNIIAGSEFKNFSVISAFSHYQNRGNEYLSYDGSGETDTEGNLKKFLTNDQRQSNYFWTKINGKDKLSDLSFQYHFQQWEFQTGHGWLWFIPDLKESMKESRHLASLKYSPQVEENISTEFLARYQIHSIFWNTRYYRNNSFDGYYPAGMWEYLDTKAEDVFLRAQVKYILDHDATLLGGIETDFFYYEGDKEHYSNIDIDNGAQPNPDNQTMKLGPWLDFIGGHIVKNIGAYGQFVSGRLISDKLNITIGLRYDMQFFDYNQIDLPGNPLKSKSFSQFSPRIAFVYSASEDIAFKAMFGKAFRAPSPTEMFSAHTYSLASNIEEVKPEKITTYELAIDWILSKSLNWRTNIFYTVFDNQIAYSAQNNNLSTNVYSLTNEGIESELLFGYKGFSGFINISYVKRVSEEIQDTTIDKSSDLTWVPPLKVNFGLSYFINRFHFSLNGHYQDAVARRQSDKGLQELPLGVGVILDMDEYRGQQVNSWFTVDLSVGYIINDFLKLGVSIYNLFNAEYYLIKNIGFPFDYRQSRRRYTLNLQTTF